jgi:DNA polymerase alpha subunit A
VVVEKVHEYLRELATAMREFKIPVQKYTIFTQLGKAPSDYPNGGSMPSVQVALRQIAKGKHIKAKDVMSFIITGQSNGSAEQAAKSAYPMEDVLKQDSELKPDIDYYLHKQILPPVERLCAPISGTDVTHLADCLGLDTSKYRVSTVSGNGNSNEADIQPLESQVPDAVRFKDAVPLQLSCRSCKTNFAYRGLISPPSSLDSEIKDAIITHDGVACPNESCKKLLLNLTLVAQTEAHIRQHIARYYSNWLVCNDQACGMRTRQISVYGHRCLGPKGLAKDCLGVMQPEYTEKMLYNQLLYTSSIFDVDRAWEKIEKEGREGVIGGEKKEKIKILVENNRDRFETVKDVVRGYLEKNGRQWVQMDTLFGFALKVV